MPKFEPIDNIISCVWNILWYFTFFKLSFILKHLFISSIINLFFSAEDKLNFLGLKRSW